MKNIPFKSVAPAALLLLSLLLSQCKSVEFTAFGVINKIYGQETTLPKTVTENTNKQKNLIVLDSTIEVSGYVTDSLNHSLQYIDIYLEDRNIIEYHTSTDQNGKYTIQSVIPNTYNVHLVAPDYSKYKELVQHLDHSTNHKQINFTF